MDKYQMATAVLSVALAAFTTAMKPPQPHKIANVILWTFAAVAVTASAFGEAYPSPDAATVVGLAVVAFALVPPVMGIAFAVPRANRDIYDYLSETGAPTTRFWMHLGTNLLGGLTVLWALEYAANTATASYPENNDANVLSNVVVPLAVLIIMSFVRGQQLERVPKIKKLSKKRAVPRESRSYLLSAPPEFANTIYLIIATYLAFASILLRLTSIVTSAKSGDPQDLTVELILLFVVGTCFLLLCGTPWATSSRYVYLTFLTGTPVAMGTVLFFLALLDSGTARNVFALVYLAVTGAAYGALVVLRESRISDGKFQDKLHHFTGAIVAGVIGILLLMVLLS